MGDGVSYYDRPYEIVNGQIGDMATRADSAIAVANAVIGALSTLNIEISEKPPQYNLSGIDLPAGNNINPPDPSKFGLIEQLAIPAFQLFDAYTDDIDIDAGDFTAPYKLQRPPAPHALDTSGMPTRPDFGTVDIPVFDVDTGVPPLQALDDIAIPAFVFPSLPSFNEMPPEFNVAPPVTILQWSEPPYESEILDQVKSRLSLMLAGGTGLPPAIEAALFDRARGREDVLALKSEQDAFDTFAARGFSMPPGMLVKQVQAVQEENRLKTSAINRDILIKATDVEIENIRFAVTQGIALEQLLMNLFNNVVNRAFEAAKFRVEADIRLYDALVGAFNARQTAYQVAAQVYEIGIRGELAKLEAYKVQMEGLKIRGELNQQKVAIFNALVEAVKNRIQAYTARVEGAKAQADVVRANIEGYRVDVQAYGARLDAQKTVFDAYEASVRAETALAQGNEAAARAFAATIQAQEARANVKIAVIRAKIEALQASVQKYAALLQAEQSRIGAQRDAIQATAAAYGAEMQRYTAEIGKDTATRQLDITRQESNLRNALAYYEINVKEYDAQMTRLIEAAKVQEAALDSAGRSAAQLAAGAMAAINVGASLSGSAGVSDSFSNSVSKSYNFNYDSDDAPPPA